MPEIQRLADEIPRNGEAAPPELRFAWASELRDATPEEPPWVVTGYLARGAVTMVAGKPKAGKSTWAWAVADAVAVEAASFLGRQVAGGPVVFVTEEGAGTLRHKLPGAAVRVLTRDAAWPKPRWSELVRAAVAEARRIGAALLVIDALSFWAGFGENQEKDAGAAQAVMDTLQAATGTGLAVLLVHHQRKAGGEDGDAARGSGAIFGAVDALLERARAGDKAPPGQRRLVATGRWPSMAQVMVIDRDPAGAWRVIGEAADRRETDALGMRERILRALPADEPGSTEAELVQTVGVHKKKVSGPLRELVEDGLAAKAGEGKPYRPFRYTRAPSGNYAPNSAPTGAVLASSTLPLPLTGAEEDSHSAPCPGAESASVGDDDESELW